MISYAYVNGYPEDTIASSALLSFEHALEQFDSSCEKAITTFLESCDSFFIESDIMGEDMSEDKVLAFEAANENIFAKIGNSIIEITKKFIEFVNDIIDKLKNLSFNRKKDFEKVELLCKEHPEYKEKIMKAFEDGDLTIANVKSFNDLEDAFDELCKMAKKKDIKPGSLEDKWEKAKSKFEKADKMTIVKVAGAVATVMGAIAAVDRFAKTRKDNAKSRQDKVEKALDDMRFLKSREPVKYQALYNDEMGKFHIIVNAHRYINGKESAALDQSNKAIDKVTNKILTFVDNATSKEAKKAFHDELKLKDDIASTLRSRTVNNTYVGTDGSFI